MRVFWIDLLRIISATAVISVHAASPFYASLEPTSVSWWFSNVVMTTAKSIGTPIFVMIAGYVLLGKKSDYNNFYKTRARRILIPLVFWSVLYSLFAFVFLDNSVKDLIWRMTVGMVLTGKAYFHLWYLSMFFWLMLFTPILSKLVHGEKPSYIDLKVFFLIAIVFFAMSSLSNIKEAFSEGIDWYSSFGVYVFYFMLGYLIPQNIKRINITSKNLMLIYVAVLLVCMAFNFGAVSLSYSDDNLFIGNDTIFGFLSAVLIFTIFAKIEPGENHSYLLSRITQNSYGVYLIHPLVLFFVSKIGVMLSLDPPVAIVASVVVVAIVSFFLVGIIRKSQYGRIIS